MPPPKNAPVGIYMRNRYIKDMSFENPGAPMSSTPGTPQPQPNIAINVEVGGRRQKFLNEVVLSVNATASVAAEIIFIAEVRYAGLFEISGMDHAAREEFIYVEAPRILFPFVERIIADVTRDGGLPPLSLTPPDFEAIYRRRDEKDGNTAAADANA